MCDAVFTATIEKVSYLKKSVNLLNLNHHANARSGISSKSPYNRPWTLFNSWNVYENQNNLKFMSQCQKMKITGLKHIQKKCMAKHTHQGPKQLYPSETRKS
jgi:hypothetical protein